MNDSVIAGALFDFMGWLTSRPKRIMLSSVDDATPAVDAIRDFAKMRGLSLDDARVTDWQDALAQPEQEQEPVAWVYPEGLEALKAGKPWTAYGTRQEPNNTALYLSPQPDIAPYAWVTFTPYGDEDDVWYENPKGQLLEGWTYKPLYDTSPPQRKPLTNDLYNELLFAVETKCPDETRHQTALRYIRQAEMPSARPAQAAHGIKENRND